MDRFDVTGRAVLITGGHQGIGQALARAFAGAGADVTILDVAAGVGETAARLADEAGRPVRALHCDVTDRAALGAALAGAGSIDVLINNAGVAAPSPLSADGAELEAIFRRVLEVNLLGVVLTTHAALPHMAAGGRIIMTASIWGKTAGPEFSAYVASKHAVIGLTRSFAMELGPRGITVNAVCPGTINTSLTLDNVPEEMRGEVMASMVLHPGMLEPDHLAGSYLFLASDAAAEITGQTLNVDRGQVMF